LWTEHDSGNPEEEVVVMHTIRALAIFAMLAFAASTAGAQTLDGSVCAGTMRADNGHTGAAAFVFSTQNGAFMAHHFYGLGAPYHDHMAQAIAASPRPAYDWLTDGGFASNVRVDGAVVTFEKRGIDPRYGTPVVFRTYRMMYVGGRMTGQSLPVNDVMENGGRGRPTNFDLVCFPAARHASG
jgi:hypothetical protein